MHDLITMSKSPKWFDLWLKGESNDFKEITPRVQYYTMGSNQWQFSNAWPPENTGNGDLLSK